MDDQLNQRHSAPPKADFNVEVGDDNHVNVIDENDNLAMTNKTKPTKKNFLYRLKHRELTKKDYIIIFVALLVIAAVIGSYFIFHKNPKPATNSNTSKSVIVAPPSAKSRLTGLPVTAAQYNLPVTAVMIENSDEARPQSGLSQAGVVFEAVAEGGITRFVALYEEGEPSSIGPIRSARPYYIDWMLPFDASYVHAGGSADALAYITQENVKNLDEFYNGNSFTRISTRAAPHNLYASMSQLLALENSKGYKTSTFTGFPRKADSPSKTPNAVSIDISPAGPDYASHYDYDKTTNSYKRSEGGSVMVDANTNTQLSPKVVIAIVVPESQGALDASGAYYTDYTDIGSGAAYVFQDGTVTVGTWTKNSPSNQMTFTDASGNTIKLNAGQTWITAIGQSSYVTYQ